MPVVSATLAEPAPERVWLHRLLLLVAAVTAVRVVTLYTSGLELFFDEAQYWTWSLDPAFGYYSKPPMVAWLIAATTAVCGDGEACVRLSSPLLYAVSTAFVWLTALRLFDARTAFWSAATFLTLPGVSVSSGLVSTDVPLLLFWSVALYAYVRMREGGGIGWWLLLGAALGLGLLSKYAMTYLLLSLGLLALVSAEDRRRLLSPGGLAALAFGLAIWAPNLAWNAAHGFASIAHTADNVNIGGGSLLNPDKMAEFFGSQFGVFGPILFGALLLLILDMRRLGADARFRLLLCFTLPVIVLILGQSLMSRAHANWAAVSYVAGAILVPAWLLTRARGVAWLRASLALHLVAAALVYNADGIVRAAGIEPSARHDPFARMRGWSELGERVGAHFADHPDAVLLADERRHLVELIYYSRPRPEAVVKWSPTERVFDHYDLTTDIRDHADRRFILVTRHFGAGHVTPRFEAATLLEDVRVRTHPDAELHFEVYLLERFKGYRD